MLSPCPPENLYSPVLYHIPELLNIRKCWRTQLQGWRAGEGGVGAAQPRTGPEAERVFTPPDMRRDAQCQGWGVRDHRAAPALEVFQPPKRDCEHGPASTVPASWFPRCSGPGPPDVRPVVRSNAVKTRSSAHPSTPTTGERIQASILVSGRQFHV